MIKDQIVKGNLDDFRKEFNYEKLDEDTSFEHFVNYLILSRINSQIFEDNDFLDNINVDKGKNFGIDGIALLINNSLIFSNDNIETFKKSSEHYPSLNMSFVFTQAKTSASFDTGEILKFILAVKEFLLDKNIQKSGGDIEKFKALKEVMINYDTLKCVDRSTGPSLNLFFATTGTTPTDKLLLSLVENQRKELEKTFDYFKSVNINLVSKESLIKYNQEIQNKVEARIIFKDKVDLGGMKGVGKAFLGYLPANEYLKLITDDEGNFRRNLFYENVRDFKGEENKVNKEIAETIKNGSFRDKFVLMNNGVTIVTKLIDTNFQGGEMKVFNYQIVNGCQTSNVLYLNRSHIAKDSNILIPLKLIECQDNDITNEITKATNNQNPVPEEAFIALEHFPKTLQAFFDNISKNAPTKIYYERRSREYDYIQPKINQSQIFHLHKLIRAIVAMFVEQPHSCHRFPGELYKQTKSVIFGKERKMFTKDQSPFPYYTSCYTWYVIEQMFYSGEIYQKYKPFKFHLLMLVKLLIDNSIPKNFENLRESEKYCTPIINKIWDKDELKRLVIISCSLIEKGMKEETGKSSDSLTRSSDFTNKLKEMIKEKGSR